MNGGGKVFAKVAHADPRSRPLQGISPAANRRFRPVAHEHPFSRALQATSPAATLAKIHPQHKKRGKLRALSSPDEPKTVYSTFHFRREASVYRISVSADGRVTLNVVVTDSSAEVEVSSRSITAPANDGFRIG